MLKIRSLIPSGLLIICVVLASFSWSPLPSQAQSAESTAPSLSLVARGTGATLLNATDGTAVISVGPGTRLTATERSTDGAWFLVTTSTGEQGWVASSNVLAFNVDVLPTRQIRITSVATPEPTQATAEAEPVEDEPAADEDAEPAEAQTNDDDAAATATPVSQSQSVTNTLVVTVTTTTGNLNVRSGPGTGYGIIGKARNGQALTAQGRNANSSWLQVQLPNSATLGWVSASYVNAGGSAEGLAVVTVPQQPAAPPPTAPTANAPSESAAPADPAPTVALSNRQSTGPTGLSGKLVVHTGDGGLFYIYHLATGELRPLTHGFDPAISPDGQWVAFTRGGGDHGLYVINVDGSGERRVFGEREGFWSPKWSPDGQRIVFVRWDISVKCKDYSSRMRRYNCQSDKPGDGDLPYMMEVRPRLASVDLNGENYLDLATLDTASAPDWNEAGVVYASDGGIQITTLTSQEPSQLVHFDVYQQYYHDPDWQPGGGRIVLQQRRPSHWEIFAVNPDGSDYGPLTRPATVLVDSLPSNVAPAWSPDGRHIVFLSNRTEQNSAGDWRVWVMDADGSNQRPLPIDLPISYNFVEEQMLDWGR